MTQEEKKLKEIIKEVRIEQLWDPYGNEYRKVSNVTEIYKKIFSWHTSELNRKMEEVLTKVEDFVQHDDYSNLDWPSDIYYGDGQDKVLDYLKSLLNEKNQRKWKCEFCYDEFDLEQEWFEHRISKHEKDIQYESDSNP